MIKPNEQKHIALFYGTKEKNDASETFEDLISELKSWGFTPKRQSKTKLEYEDVVFSFYNIEKNDNIFKKGNFFEKIYMSTHLKNYEFQCGTISNTVIYHPYPFQSLIDMVLEVKGKK